MKKNVTRLVLLTLVLSMTMLLNSCFTIWEVTQPTSVDTGGAFETVLHISTNDTDENAKYGILGLLIPDDMTVNGVTYTGDYGEGTFSFLHSDSADAYPSDLDFGWADTLELLYPSGDNQSWVVYQADEAYAPTTDTNYVDITVSFTAGSLSGNLGYLITEASTDFTDEGMWDVSLNNMLGVGVLSISDIQDTTGTGSDASALSGETVTVTGIVSAESYAFGGSNYWIQDGTGKWSGVLVYDGNHEAVYGDSIMLTGTVNEYYNVTQIKNISAFSVLSQGHEVEPTVVTTGEIATDGTNAEAYEGVLVKVVDAEITNPDAGYGQWYVSDGSGDVMLDDVADYYFDAVNYDSVKSVTGVLHYSYSDHKILPRLACDIVEGGDYVRIQRIQQVRYSDLLKTPLDQTSDFSYMVGDTVKVKGVVTMPTGLSYAGAGIKFIFAEEGGGPWASILSYHSDSSAYPTLWEGDLIEMTGYIAEYSTGGSNMTEFFITSPINILNMGQELPAVDTINTGDLRLPVTAEQWGNSIVAVKDAIVGDVNPQYYMFEVDDGTGSIMVGSDSDSLADYPDPPMGSILESVSGWVYHHYGSYADSSTYNINPLYADDIVLGAGPPQLLSGERTPGVPTSSDAVTVSIDVTTNSTIAAAKVFYSVDGGAYQSADLAVSTKGDIYSGEIPAQVDGSFVEYFIEVTDTEAQSSTDPADTSAFKYGYKIADAGLKIADIQYSPWTIANSPFDGYKVEVTGIVTVDTAFKNAYDAYFIQDGAGAWNGICAFGVNDFLKPGDEVTVYGQVHEQNPDWTFKWGNNTVVITDSVKILSEGNALPAVTEVTTVELANDSEVAEMYEGCLVKVLNGEVTALNSYDWSFDDGSGSCLIDDDAAGAELSEWFDSLKVGTTVDFVQGPLVFSFGTFKITPRNMGDVAQEVGLNDNPIGKVFTYKLNQNYPNPFNPDTRIAFEIPKSDKVKIVIYNIMGQQVRTLTNQNFRAGYHVLNWDACNNAGSLVSSGTYIVRMRSGDFIQTRKMLLIR